jgi:hypothetical protein
MAVERDHDDRDRDERARRLAALRAEVEAMDAAAFAADHHRLALMIFRDGTATSDESLRYQAGLFRAVRARMAERGLLR